MVKSNRNPFGSWRDLSGAARSAVLCVVALVVVWLGYAIFLALD